MCVCLFVCVCVCVSKRKTKDRADGMRKKVPFPLTRFEPVPLGYAPIVPLITPRVQARLASVETNTSDTHQLHRETQACITCVCVCACVRESVCVRACACVCVCARARAHFRPYHILLFSSPATVFWRRLVMLRSMMCWNTPLLKPHSLSPLFVRCDCASMGQVWHTVHTQESPDASDHDWPGYEYTLVFLLFRQGSIRINSM